MLFENAFSSTIAAGEFRDCPWILLFFLFGRVSRFFRKIGMVRRFSPRGMHCQSGRLSIWRNAAARLEMAYVKAACNGIPPIVPAVPCHCVLPCRTETRGQFTYDLSHTVINNKRNLRVLRQETGDGGFGIERIGTGGQ